MLPRCASPFRRSRFFPSPLGRPLSTASPAAYTFNAHAARAVLANALAMADHVEPSLPLLDKYLSTLPRDYKPLAGVRVLLIQHQMGQVRHCVCEREREGRGRPHSSRSTLSRMGPVLPVVPLPMCERALARCACLVLCVLSILGVMSSPLSPRAPLCVRHRTRTRMHACSRRGPQLLPLPPFSCLILTPTLSQTPLLHSPCSAHPSVSNLPFPHSTSRW